MSAVNNSNKRIINIGYWNVGGMGTLSHLDNTEVNKLLEYDILCLCETWLCTDNFIIPPFLSGYQVFYSKAERTFAKGRGSGGLLVLIRRSLGLDTREISKCNQWLFLLVKLANLDIVLGVVYFKPSIDFSSAMQNFDVELCRIRLIYEDCGMIGG